MFTFVLMKKMLSSFVPFLLLNENNTIQYKPYHVNIIDSRFSNAICGFHFLDSRNLIC